MERTDDVETQVADSASLMVAEGWRHRSQSTSRGCRPMERRPVHTGGTTTHVLPLCRLISEDSIRVVGLAHDGHPVIHFFRFYRRAPYPVETHSERIRRIWRTTSNRMLGMLQRERSIPHSTQALTVHTLMLASPPALRTFDAFSQATPVTPSL